MIAAAHPVDRFDADTAQLLSQVARASVTCVNPRLGVSLEEMVDDLEAARRSHGIERWTFWGMSGGGWLAQLYAHRYPSSLDAVIIESADASFRARLADPACILSPAHPIWRRGLAGASVVKEGDTVVLASPVPLSPAMQEAMPAFLAFDARPWLASLTVPALVIAGAADPIAPVAGVRAVAETIPGARFVEVPGAGHVPTTEGRPEVAAAVRAFLADLRN